MAAERRSSRRADGIARVVEVQGAHAFDETFLRTLAIGHLVILLELYGTSGHRLALAVTVELAEIERDEVGEPVVGRICRCDALQFVGEQLTRQSQAVMTYRAVGTGRGWRFYDIPRIAGLGIRQVAFSLHACDQRRARQRRIVSGLPTTVGNGHR